MLAHFLLIVFKKIVEFNSEFDGTRIVTGLELDGVTGRQNGADGRLVFKVNRPTRPTLIFFADRWQCIGRRMEMIPEGFPFGQQLQNGQMETGVPVEAQLVDIDRSRPVSFA